MMGTALSWYRFSPGGQFIGAGARARIAREHHREMLGFFRVFTLTNDLTFKKHAATLKNRRPSKLVQKDNYIEKSAFLRSCRRDCFISEHTKTLHCGLG